MKRFFRILIYTVLVLFILIQFYPRPKKNNETVTSQNNITAVHVVPVNVQQVFKKSCNDCHSDQTIYPWYYNFQPVAMWMGNHIIEGKRELNFSEFGSYSIRRQYKKLDEIAEMVEENEMPLSSYTLIHKDAKLSETDKKILTDWVSVLRDSIKANYPEDSLARIKH